MRPSHRVLIAGARTARKRGTYVLYSTLLLACLLSSSTAQTKPPKTSEISAHMQRGQAALKAKDVETAIAEFRTVLTLDPRNAEANLNLGVIEFAKSDYRAASQHFRNALAIRPAIPQAQALLGICEKKLGNSSAQRLLENSFAKLTDVRLRTQVGLELIGLYYQQGASERAIPVIQKLVDLNPDDLDILYTAQRLYSELAEETLNKLALLAPGSARMQQIIAESLINVGDLQGAIDHYKKALELDARIPGVRYELAQAILESAKGDASAEAAAVRELETAITMEGDSDRLQCQLGKIALQRGDSENAYTHYSRAIALAPGDGEAQLGLGRVLMTMEKPEEARKYLEMAIQSDPLNGAAHYRLALAYRRLEMTEEAKKEMHLFQEIKKAKDQVQALYKQMNRRPKQQADDVPENDQ